MDDEWNIAYELLVDEVNNILVNDEITEDYKVAILSSILNYLKDTIV